MTLLLLHLAFTLPFGIDGHDIAIMVMGAVIGIPLVGAWRKLRQIYKALHTLPEDREDWDYAYSDLCERKRWPWRVGEPRELRKVRKVVAS